MWFLLKLRLKSKQKYCANLVNMVLGGGGNCFLKKEHR